MVKTIFSGGTMAVSKRLVMSENGMFVYTTENDGHSMLSSGLQEHEETLTCDQAKVRWPRYAVAIQKAYDER